jgi:hypothetical protein
MARVIAMLDEARAAGLDVHRDGADLIVRGRAGLGQQARELLDRKPLMLAALDHEDECRGHEHSEHLDQPVDLAAHGGWQAGLGRMPSGRPPRW